MKNKQFLVFIFLIVVFNVNAIKANKNISQEQDTETIVAVFDGYNEEDGYAFLVSGEDDEEDEDIMYFYEVTEEALKVANLKSDDLIGKRFQITYKIETYEEEDEYGYKETYEKYTIIKIKKM
ncbi:hypothetical protein BWZ20_06760 [Winogradskyella sp. J14-2]|uniref:hypothetical protein n=1 Tax=Winogradskyella sp. J14-2 TaxID=1936080 RepID=UPI000972D6ED|nr:hypothetical protein [Winogradskyella sp. J14-2]APY08018.1 hypothetical protein BWZ20_06760 [Winogradskyella sp. J14-2]